MLILKKSKINMTGIGYVHIYVALCHFVQMITGMYWYRCYVLVCVDCYQMNCIPPNRGDVDGAVFFERLSLFSVASSATRACVPFA